MPILYTRLENASGVHRDEQGIEYPSLDDAVKRAGITAGQVLSDDLAAGHRSVSIKVQVESPDGSTLATVSVKAEVTRN